MNISKENFFLVASDLNISKAQMEAFWKELEKFDQESSGFSKYLFYLGAMVIISAMTWFMNWSWERFGGGGIFLLAVIYALIFTTMGSALWKKKGLKIPAGLFITIAVCMVPLAIYGLEIYFNILPSDLGEKYGEYYSSVQGKWIFMELGTIVAGAIALYFFPFPFLTAPIFFAAWFLTMDIVPAIFGKEISWEQKCWITLYFGIALIAIGFAIDFFKKRDYAFWSYLFGTLSFWGGLNCLVWDKGEIILFIYLLINLAMMCLSILIRRNVLMIFGAIGVFAYLGHLAYDIFEDSILFPLVLSFIGLGIIYMGILYQRNAKSIEKKMQEKLPAWMRDLLEQL